MYYGWRFVILYRRQKSIPFPRKRNAKRKDSCVAVKREVKDKKEKERNPFECRVPKNNQQR